MYLPQFQAVGHALVDGGLITGASGNLSIRLKDKLIITRHGSRLSALTADDLIETGIKQDDSTAPLASWELPVHRAVYLRTRAGAIVHAHPPCAVTLSLLGKEIELSDRVSVVGASAEIVPGALADEIALALKRCPLVMVNGHGSFATGGTLGEAGELTARFEEGCERLCRARSLAVKERQE